MPYLSLSGPAHIIATLEETTQNCDMHMIAGSALWSILDTSEMRMDVELIRRTVNVACQSIGNTLQQDDNRDRGLLANVDLDHVKRKDMLFTLLGVLWNIPVSESYSHLINSCCADLPEMLLDVLHRSLPWNCLFSSRVWCALIHAIALIHLYRIFYTGVSCTIVQTTAVVSVPPRKVCQSAVQKPKPC